jgi:DNA-binding response OmpR family regulator
VTRILVVDDDATVAEVVTRYLEREGFSVTSVEDAPAALEAARVEWPALVVLDLMLPGMSGLELLRELRGQAEVPVIMLTAKGTEVDRVAGLDLGADDYMAKPFSPRELAARVRSVLRRSTGPDADLGADRVRVFDELCIDLRARTVSVANTEVALTAREFDLLAFLSGHPGTAFDRTALLEQVWGWTYGDASTVTVHIRRLRAKLERNPSAPVHLLTVWGVGYRFAA